ncbi:MAG: hypothetical protein JWN98_115, partial [Abditibacteriota bacterium]|nr:hypothetical protein [Abditibacteriota bacterium]
MISPPSAPPAASPTQDSPRAGASAPGSQHSSRRKLGMLLPLLGLLLALAVWINADALRRWQYRHTPTT